MERIASGRTMIIVSHRLSSLADCDQILVMEQRRIVDCGKHEVLLPHALQRLRNLLCSRSALIKSDGLDLGPQILQERLLQQQ